MFQNGADDEILVGLVVFGEVEDIGGGEGGEVGGEALRGIGDDEEAGAVEALREGAPGVFYGETCFTDAAEAVDCAGLGYCGGGAGRELRV